MNNKAGAILPNGKIVTNVYEAYEAGLADQSARIAELEEQLEYERIRLAACGVAALSNTDESVKDRIDDTNKYWSASYMDVCAAVDREMALRQQLTALQAKRDPLSDEEIDNILNSAEAESGGSHRFARAIEAAHGIGVDI